MKQYSKRRTGNRYALTVKRAINLGAKAYQTYTKYKKWRNPPVDNGITVQQDSRLQYKKKPMPKYKKKKWTSFKKKVAAASDESGTQTLVFNDNITNSTGLAPNSQLIAVAHLYGNCGIAGVTNDEIGKRDLDRIKLEIGDAPSQKIKFKSACLDITYQAGLNTGDAPVEVDVYHVTYRKTPSGLGRDSFGQAMATAEGAGTTFPTTGAITFSSRGSTLFNYPLMLSQCGMTILRKSKHFVPIGGTFTYQIRDPKNRYTNTYDIDGSGSINSFIKPGWTQSLVFVTKPTAAFTSSTYRHTLGISRTYVFSQEGYRDERAGIINGYAI